MNDRETLEAELKRLEHENGLISAVRDGATHLGADGWFEGHRYTVSIQPRSTPADQPRRHLICIDGTWNEPESDTNVVRLAAALHNAGDPPHDQLVRYYNGVGIRLNQGPSLEMRLNWKRMYESAADQWTLLPESWREWCRAQAERLDPALTRTQLGGGLGLGLHDICRRAYFDLVASYLPGDEIFIFGFSRGATIARLLAKRIADTGVPSRLEATFVQSQLEYDVIDREFALEPTDDPAPPITMLGVWDTVASWVIPGEHRIHAFSLDLTVAENVDEAYHLVAVDERREAFAPTLMRQQDKVHEIWFPGVHTNVGGGYTLPDTDTHDYGLSDIALQFMLNRLDDHGVRFDRARIDPPLTVDVTGAMAPWDWPLSHDDRRIRVEGARTALPRIHKSVEQRMAADRSYRPPSVLNLDGRYDLEERD